MSVLLCPSRHTHGEGVQETPAPCVPFPYPFQPQMVTGQPPYVSKLRLEVYHVTQGNLPVMFPLLGSG